MNKEFYVEVPSMDPQSERLLFNQRRQLLMNSGRALGAAAVAMLNGQLAMGATSSSIGGNTGLPGVPHFAPKAKRVIYLFMAGGPQSHRHVGLQACVKGDSWNGVA